MCTCYSCGSNSSAPLCCLTTEGGLENIAVYSCYFIGQLQESILLRVHWISIYRVHALRAFSFIFCACAKLIAIATRVIDRTVWTVWQLVSPCFACASAYVSKPVLV